MRVLVFSTEVPGHPQRSSPYVILPDRADAFLPRHPDAREWQYFVTASLDDALFSAERDEIASAIATDGYYITNLPMRGLMELQS